jgi:TRAP-type C4-dicarboxylate transport system permease small subunit
MKYYTYFSSAYGACSYGGSAYQNGSCQTTTTAGGNSGSGNPLTNTGFDILLIVTIACVLIFIALIVRIWRRPRKQQPVSGAKQDPVETGIQDHGQGKAE